jgi:high-affinity nickel-transport protein
MQSALGITLVSCAVLGFRHGFDYDHIAAITDITSVQQRPRDGMRLGLFYAGGHAAMIALLGSLVIAFQMSLPHRLDAWAERLVGFTLILLALYVLGTLVWGDPQAIPPSRGALMIRGYRKLRRRFWPGSLPEGVGGEEDLNYTGGVAFGIGVIHGLGAETPSQLALFLLAANLGGVGKGVAGMGMFIVGLLVMNTLMTASACGLFRVSAMRPNVMRFFIGATAVYSFVVGCIFLLGSAGQLPSIG